MQDSFHGNMEQVSLDLLFSKTTLVNFTPSILNEWLLWLSEQEPEQEVLDIGLALQEDTWVFPHLRAVCLTGEAVESCCLDEIMLGECLDEDMLVGCIVRNRLREVDNLNFREIFSSPFPFPGEFYFREIYLGETYAQEPSSSQELYFTRTICIIAPISRTHTVVHTTRCFQE